MSDARILGGARITRMRTVAAIGLVTTLALASLTGCSGKSSVETDNAPVATTAEKGPVRLTVAVEPKQARLSDELTLTVTIDAADGTVVTKPPFGDEIGEFVVRDFQEALPRTADGRQITTQILKLEPITTGSLRIDPITVEFESAEKKKETVQSESLTIAIASALGDNSADLADLKPAVAPVELPGSIRWLAAIAIASGLGILAIGAFVWRKYRKSRQEPITPQLSPRELAALELERLLSSGLSETDLKVFYVELTAIVRRYIERTAGIHAPEQTTEEFLREISQHPRFSASQRDKLANFLESADLVKFAGYQPMASAVDESVRRARVFVDLEPDVTLPHEPVRNGWHSQEKALLSAGEKDVTR